MRERISWGCVLCGLHSALVVSGYKCQNYLCHVEKGQQQGTTDRGSGLGSGVLDSCTMLAGHPGQMTEPPPAPDSEWWRSVGLHCGGTLLRGSSQHQLNLRCRPKEKRSEVSVNVLVPLVVNE